MIESGAAPQVKEAVGAPSAPSPQSRQEMKGVYSPALLRIARENGIGLDQLEKIPWTGMGGRLTKNDLEEYVSRKSAAPKPCPMASKPATPAGADVERLKMTGMRKAIADNMARSFYEAPHATLVAEVDVTSVIKLLQKEKETFFQKHGCKLTITAFIAKAIARALQEYPLINSSLEGDTILVKRFINLGIAVSVDQGLMVPVVKHCQGMGLTAIAKRIGSFPL